MSKPDAALLWARESAAKRAAYKNDADAIRSGLRDDAWGVRFVAEAFRAGQSHTDGLVAALEKIILETTDVTRDLDNYGMCILAVNSTARAALTAAKGQQ